MKLFCSSLSGNLVRVRGKFRGCGKLSFLMFSFLTKTRLAQTDQRNAFDVKGGIGEI